MMEKSDQTSEKNQDSKDSAVAEDSMGSSDADLKNSALAKSPDNEHHKPSSGIDEYLGMHDSEDRDISVTESRLGNVRGYRQFLLYTGLMWLMLLLLEWFFPLFLYENINTLSSFVPNFLGGKIENFALTTAGEIPHVFMTAFLATFCFLSFYGASQPAAKGLVLGMALSELLLGGLFLIEFYSRKQPFFVFSLTGYFFTILALMTFGVFLYFLNRIPD